MLLATIAFWMGRHVFVHVPASPGGRLGLIDTISSTLLFMAFIGLPMFFMKIMGTGPCLATSVGCAVLGFGLFLYRQRLQQDDGFLALTVAAVTSVFDGSAQAAKQAAEAADVPADSVRRSTLFAGVAQRFGEDKAEGPTGGAADHLGLPAGERLLVALRPTHVVLGASGDAHGSACPLFGELLPSQIQSLNPLMVMLLIPFTNYLFYPLLERIGLVMTPLRRITLGMLVAGFAFVGVAIIQGWIDNSEANSISVMWQVGPYFIITLAEVMVSITGLEFAYSQAPRAMKSTIMGFWLLSVALGNKLVAVLSTFEDLALVNFFWLFAGLMAVAALLFGLFAMFYTYRDYTQDSETSTTT